MQNNNCLHKSSSLEYFKTYQILKAFEHDAILHGVLE